MTQHDIDIPDNPFSEKVDTVQERTRSLYRTIIPIIPWTAFVGGFLFDIVTLGREVSILNLYVISGYAVVTCLALVLHSRMKETWKARKFVFLVLHFALGSLFSALVVLYFRSSGALFTFLAVLLLFSGMVFNELLGKAERQIELRWAITAVSLTMLLNFLVPHWVGTVRPFWFYASCAFAVAFICLLVLVAGLSFKTLRAAVLSALLLVVLYVLGLIPPVPLVMKNSIACVDYRREPGEYICKVEERPLDSFRRDRVRRTSKERVFFLTAVWAPADVALTFEHRWFFRSDDGWRGYDVMEFEMRGGRKGGWRVNSRKGNLQDGLWRVDTALKGGSVLSRHYFHVETVPDHQEIERLDRYL